MSALIVGSLAGCGGGGDSSGGGTTTPPPTNLAGAISAAAADPANDAATNPGAVFNVMQNAGAAVVTVASPPVIRFTVISDGKVVQGLNQNNVRIALAKLVRGTNGNPDDWVNYYSGTEVPNPNVGPGGSAVLPGGAPQASTDPRSAAQFVYKADGYYEYTFQTDVLNVTDPLDPTKKLWDPSATHRVGMQLSYQNAAGETIQNNPTFDFTFSSASGAFTSVAVTDPAQTRKVVDVTSCNQCHGRLAVHGEHRFDPQFCVMCHNERTTDANSGNNLRMKTMIHKVHAGRRLANATPVGQDYMIWGYGDSLHDFADSATGHGVGFPQDLRNCTKCHDGNKSAQADNWKTKPTKQACLTCHTTDPGSDWNNMHVVALKLYASGDYADINNTACANCHGAGQPWSPDRMHFNQAEAHSSKYKMTIESVAYNSATRQVTVVYYLCCDSGGQNWDLSQAQFTGGSMRLYLAYMNLPGQKTDVTEFSSYNNGGSNVRVNMEAGTPDGAFKYTAVMTIPADDVANGKVLAGGTARVLSSGRVVETAVDIDGTPTGDPSVNVAVQHAFQDFALTGSVVPRRVVVSNEKCNACHSTLGTAAGSNTHLSAFHRGERNYVEACVHCHDAGRVSTGTVMADGSTFNESYSFRRMIHALHAASSNIVTSQGAVRKYPYTHDNTQVGAFDKDCKLISDPTIVCNDGGDPTAVTNFAKEVEWPGIIGDCNTCHVNDSWKQDKGPLGSVITAAGGTQSNGGPNAVVISPKAAVCTSCHDGLSVQNHVRFAGGAAFGTDAFGTTIRQGDIVSGGVVAEICDGCHKPGSGVTSADISIVHPVK